MAAVPDLCLEALRELNQPKMFSLASCQLPERIESFADLHFLFSLSPLNRGVMRLDFDEAAALYRTVSGLRKSIGVEIGRLLGGTTILLSVAVGDGGKLLSVDLAPRNDNALRGALGRWGLAGRVELLRGDSGSVPCETNLDFVFIDGDHTYDGAKSDHNRWGALVRPRGYVIHHDMSRARPLAAPCGGVPRLRTEILEKQGSALTLVEEAGSLAVFRRADAPWRPL